MSTISRGWFRRAAGTRGHSTDPTHPPPVANDRSHNVLFCGIFQDERRRRRVGTYSLAWAILLRPGGGRRRIRFQQWLRRWRIHIWTSATSAERGSRVPRPERHHAHHHMARWRDSESRRAVPTDRSTPERPARVSLPVTGGRRGSDPWPVQHLNPRRAELVGTER